MRKQGANKQSFLHKCAPFHFGMTGDPSPTFSYVLLIPGEVTLTRTISGDCAGHKSSQKLTIRRTQTGGNLEMKIFRTKQEPQRQVSPTKYKRWKRKKS